MSSVSGEETCEIGISLANAIGSPSSAYSLDTVKIAV